MNPEEKIVLMVLVAGRKQKDDLLSMLHESGIRLINVMYGKGTVKAGYLTSLLGLVPEENKVMIICVTTSNKSDAALVSLAEQFNFGEPNTGIAFTIPVDKMSY